MKIVVGGTGLIVFSIIGAATGAYAASAESVWDRFASYGSGTGQRCALHQAAVYTPPAIINAYGAVRYRADEPCADVNAPTSYIGGREFLERADGTVCSSRLWDYNSAPAVQIRVPTNEDAGNCNKWSSLRAAALGRVYRPSTSQYITADAYIYSPYAN